jgi:hypothetical protein
VARGEPDWIARWTARELNWLLGSPRPVRVAFVGWLIEDAVQLEAAEYALPIGPGGRSPEHVDWIIHCDPVGAIVVERNRGLAILAADDAEVARTSR